MHHETPLSGLCNIVTVRLFADVYGFKSVTSKSSNWSRPKSRHFRPRRVCGRGGAPLTGSAVCVPPHFTPNRLKMVGLRPLASRGGCQSNNVDTPRGGV